MHLRDFTKPSVNVAFGRHANSLGLSEIQDVDPKILVMRDEFASLGITLVRGGQFSIEIGEAWQVDNLEAPDDISVTAIVKPVKDNAGFPIPEPD